MMPSTLSPPGVRYLAPEAIDSDERDHSIIVSGTPALGQSDFMKVLPDGTSEPYSSLSGLIGELQFAIAPSDSRGEFSVGDLFTGTDTPGEIRDARITDGGATSPPQLGDLAGRGSADRHRIQHGFDHGPGVRHDGRLWV